MIAFNTCPISAKHLPTGVSICRDKEIKEAGKAETEKLGTEISIPDALRFRAFPEYINSRLAMVSLPNVALQSPHPDDAPL